MKANAEIKTEKLKSATLKDGKIVETMNYYLIMTTANGTHQINIGEKTFNTVNTLTKTK